MNAPSTVDVPDDLDWVYWVDRWDRMQDRYVPQREQRHALMVSLIRETQPSVSRVLDLGCATGSTMLPVLKAFPQADVVGIDYDPTLLVLAKHRLVHWGFRAHLIQGDLRDNSWASDVDGQCDAVVSATTLHWLAPEQIRIIPLKDSLEHYARRIQDALLKNGIRVGVDVRGETLQKRILWAQAEYIPAMCVVGNREQKAHTVSVRLRNGKQLHDIPLGLNIYRNDHSVNIDELVMSKLV